MTMGQPFEGRYWAPRRRDQSCDPSYNRPGGANRQKAVFHQSTKANLGGRADRQRELDWKGETLEKGPVSQRKVHRREICLGVDRDENAEGSENETTGSRICLGDGRLPFATADLGEKGQKGDNRKAYRS